MADSRSMDPQRDPAPPDEPVGGVPGQETGSKSKEEEAYTEPKETAEGPPPTQRSRERIQEGAEEVKREAEEVGQQVQRRVEGQAGRWTERASQQASSVAHALRAAGRDLDEQGERQFAHWSESAAEEINRVARYLEHESPRSILRDVEGIARRNPGAFLGGTFAVGLLLGRFLRSSEPESDTTLTEGGGFS